MIKKSERHVKKHWWKTPLEIISDFVFESRWRIDLPLHKLFLQSITCDLA